ncbi:Shedu anti-phage system protein SduA domain-containing protein [Flavisolibacter nicotianae]|uniref:Shedu anti-phage system protein SduA domain-containing protein n=1 Tax=Flavisolibacter nicotianae TaxID=2364882 RepID=UPI000EB509C8|nr:ATP-binding protein [Flavisolibacter nicotianae]
MSKANLKVDTRLTSILGESYRSTEYALKELVDNSWDADAENVWITLPEPFTLDPIIIKDDGSGMTEKELRNEYLFIANSRTSRKGERTPSKNRQVKGKKGIGKFAGLTVGNLMTLTTIARGTKTTVSINKEEILKSKRDLEDVDLIITSETFDENIHGTEIKLTQLHQNFSFPNSERLKQILVLEFGRQNDFRVFVNGEQTDVENIPGSTLIEILNIPEVGEVKFKCTVSEKPIKHSGVAIRVDGKIIGRPESFGLEDNEEIPRKLTKHVYAEIEVNGLKDDVTADWGAIIENSTAFQKVQEIIKPKIEDQLKAEFYQQVNAQKARLAKKINLELSKLPEHRRKFAQTALDKVLKRFYESNEKADTIISVVLDAFEKDDYFEVLANIDDCMDSDISSFAEALSDFGILEMSLIARQAQSRNRFLDYFDRLTNNMEVQEKDVHKTLEHNLWVFGNNYSLMSSNETLKSIVKKYCDKEFQGDRANRRPDLLLSEGQNGKYLLIEFKRPSHTISRDDENQAEKYRDDLFQYLGKVPMEIIVAGGKVDNRIDKDFIGKGIQLLSFSKVISSARTQLTWLLKELTQPV